jgi:hypothetical protein
MESEMAIMQIGRALLIAYSIVSCVLFARVNVARADLASDQTIGDAANRGGGLLHVYRSSEHKDEYRTEKLVRRKKKF